MTDVTTEECVAAYEKYGNQEKAAESLGLTRRSFQRRLYKAKNEDFLSNSADEMRFPADDVSAYWVKTKEGSFYVRRDTPEKDYEILREKFLDETSSYSYRYEPQQELSFNRDHLLVIDAADVHFGKLSVLEETGKEYNSDIAHRRLIGGTKKLLQKARPFGIDKILFVLGNDILHTDNPFGETTSGTRQDTDGMWWEMWERAKVAYIQAIEMCREYADVNLIFCPSNHDYRSGFHLTDYIAAWFRNDEHVDISDLGRSISHRKYVQYGANLLGFTHGDGAKESELPSLMQYEARKEWANTKFANWIVHHIHHKKVVNYGKKKWQSEKDYTGVSVLRNSSYVAENGVKVEYVRSPSEADAWHDRNGYVNQTAIECFMFHHSEGPTVRFTQFF